MDFTANGGRKQRAPRHYEIDADALKDAIFVPDVLAAHGIELTAYDLSLRRIACPIHEGDDLNFSWTEDGRVWSCWSACSESGDVITLLQRLMADLSFPDALKVLAGIARMDVSAADDPDARAKRAAARAERAERERVEDDERETRFDEVGLEADTFLRERCSFDDESGMEYLAQRGLGKIAERNAIKRDCDFKYLVSREPDGGIPYHAPVGSLVVPIHAIVFGSPVVRNLAVRYRGNGAFKVGVLRGGTTEGTFGCAGNLAFPGMTPNGVVLVEGVADYLTARQIYDRGHLVLGAHSAQCIPKIIRALGRNRYFEDHLRELPLLLVPHRDGVGGAGEKAHEAALAECKRLGVRHVKTFDVGDGNKDLNDWHCAQLARGGADV